MISATKNSFLYLSFSFSRLIIVFLGNIWISRHLGPEAFGQFSYFLSIIIYLSAIDSLCHESVVKQYLVGARDQGLILGTSSVLSLMLVLISTSIILLFGFWTLSEKLLFIVFALFIPGQFSKPFHPIANFFDIQLLAKYSSFALFIGALVSIVFRSLSVVKTNNLNYQSFGYSLQTLVYAVALYILYRLKAEPVRWSFSFRLLSEIVRKSLPIFLASALYLALAQCDIFMIKSMLGVREVGIYSIAVRLSEPWVIVSSAICTSYFSLIFNQKNSLQKQHKYYVRANQLSIYFVLILGIVLSAIIGPLVSVILGDEYQESASIFRIYFWGILFLFFANIQHIWEVYHGKYAVSLYKTGIACLLKIGLNFVLGSYWGLSGFAVASLLALFFYGFGFNLFSSVTRPYLRFQIQAFRFTELKKTVRFLRCKGTKWLKK